MECRSMLNLEGIPGCEDTPEDVTIRELVMQNSPSKTMMDRQLNACDLQFTNWQDQEIGAVTQVLDPGVDESDECIAAYPAGEIPGVEVTVGEINKDSSVKHPIIEIPGADVKYVNSKLPGVDMDFDAQPTGVEMDTGAYGKAYDAVPQEQGNKIEVYGLGKQDPTEESTW